MKMRKYIRAAALVMILLSWGTAALADEQSTIQHKAEFRRLVQKRNKLYAQLRQLDCKAAEEVKQGSEPTRIHARQVTTQDKLDLIQLRLETLAIRNELLIPPLPKDEPDKYHNGKGTGGDSRRVEESAFARGRARTRDELKSQTLKLLAAISFEQFLEKTGKD